MQSGATGIQTSLNGANQERIPQGQENAKRGSVVCSLYKVHKPQEQFQIYSAPRELQRSYSLLGSDVNKNNTTTLTSSRDPLLTANSTNPSAAIFRSLGKRNAPSARGSLFKKATTSISLTKSQRPSLTNTRTWSSLLNGCSDHPSRPKRRLSKRYTCSAQCVNIGALIPSLLDPILMDVSQKIDPL